MGLDCSQLLIQDATISLLDFILRFNLDLKQRFGEWTVGLVGRASPVSETQFQIKIMLGTIQKIDHCVNIQSAFLIVLLYDVYKSVLQ
jgi:hypothetical protein